MKRNLKNRTKWISSLDKPSPNEFSVESKMLLPSVTNKMGARSR